MASVLITGCSTGIGRATAAYLASRGHRVIATGRRLDTLAGLDVAERLELDVTDADSIKRAVACAGEIDVLVNNAGMSLWSPAELCPEGWTEELFAANFFGAVRMSREVLRGMRGRGGGRIIQVSSAAAQRVGPLLGAYAASKAALEVFSLALRLEVQQFGIEVVVVTMSGVATEVDRKRRIVDASGTPYEGLVQRAIKRAQAVRARLAAPEDVAAAIAEAIECEQPAFRYYVGEELRTALQERARQSDEDYERAVWASLQDP